MLTKLAFRCWGGLSALFARWKNAVVELIGQLSSFGGADVIENGATYRWFDPLAILNDQAGSTSDVAQFWCNSCSGQWTPTLVNITELAAQSVNHYPCFTADGIVAIGLCEIAYEWLYSIFWSSVSGHAEDATCGEVTS
jgi:hypothetical protein